MKVEVKKNPILITFFKKKIPSNILSYGDVKVC